LSNLIPSINKQRNVFNTKLISSIKILKVPNRTLIYNLFRFPKVITKCHITIRVKISFRQLERFS
jgi:hypothetical protein